MSSVFYEFGGSVCSRFFVPSPLLSAAGWRSIRAYADPFFEVFMDLTFSIVILLAEGVLGMVLLQRAKLLKSTLSFVLSALLMALAMGLRALVLDYRTLDNVGDISVSYRITDIYGNVYWTPAYIY